MAQPQFDIQNIDFKNLTPQQIQALDYIRGLNQRGGIGTTGLTGGEFAAAEELASEAPSMIERGYGPQEFNPQLEYGTRYQYHGRPGDEQTAFENLEGNVALGRMSQAEASMPYDLGFPRGEGGGGDHTSRDFSGPEAGYFTKDAAYGIAKDLGFNALGNFGLASFFGLNPAQALKYGITSSIPTLTPALMMMGKLAYGGLLDQAASDMGEGYAREARDTLNDVVASDQELGDFTASDIVGLGMLDSQAVAYNDLQNMTALGRAKAAAKSLSGIMSNIGKQVTNTGLGGWGGATSAEALEKAIAGSGHMFAGAAGLDPTFGGRGGDGGAGLGGGIGGAGGGMGHGGPGAGFGGSDGGYGDMGSDEGNTGGLGW